MNKLYITKYNIKYALDNPDKSIISDQEKQ